jgi:hypothetical protein
MLSFQSRFSIIELFTLFIIVLALYHRYRSNKAAHQMTSGMIYLYLMYTMLPVLILCVLGHQISFFS